MGEDQVITVKDAVYRVQLVLLEGIKDQNQLFAAGSLMCQEDYQDVVTERSIENLCGYPLCGNSLPTEHARKGRYRVSLKEHKVYDLQETYLFCSTSCVVNSRTFGASLPAERVSNLNPLRLNEVLRLFKNQGFDSVEEEEETMGRDGELGFSKLEIQEKTETKGGVVSLEEWIGPSNAIEGYVPKGDHNLKPLHSKTYKKGSGSNHSKVNVEDSVASKASNFESETGDACWDSKIVRVKNDENFELLPSKTTSSIPSKAEYKSTIMTESKDGESAKPLQTKELQSKKSKQGHKPKRPNQKKEKDTNFFNADFMSAIITQDEYIVSKSPPGVSRNDGGMAFNDPNGKGIQNDAGEKSIASHKSSTVTLVDPKLSAHPHQSHDEGSSSVSTVTLHSGEEAGSSKTVTKSSLKSSGGKKGGQRVSWADENKVERNGGDLCEFEKLSSTNEASGTLPSSEEGENDSSRLASAKAIAVALSEAAEAVASGQSDVTDAVSGVGIVLLSQPPDATQSEQHSDGVDAVESEEGPLKWPKRSDISSTDVFDSDRSWFDTPPEGFSLTLSPFATMWNALFTWMTSSSLAYIYGKDDSLHEEFLVANGREYPRKIIMPYCRSSEIKVAVAGSLGRSLAGVVTDFKLATPVSTLEKGLGCLLETMSFADALPSFRMKQWQVIVLLFIEALSIHRIPGLAPQLTSKKSLIPKVLDGAQLSMEEFQLLKDIVLPLSSEA